MIKKIKKLFFTVTFCLFISNNSICFNQIVNINSLLAKTMVTQYVSSQIVDFSSKIIRKVALRKLNKINFENETIKGLINKANVDLIAKSSVILSVCTLTHLTNKIGLTKKSAYSFAESYFADRLTEMISPSINSSIEKLYDFLKQKFVPNFFDEDDEAKIDGSIFMDIASTIIDQADLSNETKNAGVQWLNRFVSYYIATGIIFVFKNYTYYMGRGVLKIIDELL